MNDILARYNKYVYYVPQVKRVHLCPLINKNVFKNSTKSHLKCCYCLYLIQCTKKLFWRFLVLHLGILKVVECLVFLQLF